MNCSICHLMIILDTSSALKGKHSCCSKNMSHTNILEKSLFTVQLGYCDSDVTVCLLFWNMPIIQDRDVEYPYKQCISYLLAF